jgi:hypothetical protein
VNVLGIDVDATLLSKWHEWYAPEVQPFFVDSTRGLPRSLDGEFTAELRDSFKQWSPANRAKKVVWFDESRAREAGLAFRCAEDVLAFVEQEGRIPHIRVTGAPSLAGTFPFGSGPNCFGTTMAGAGVANAENEWMMIEPFNDWLHASCTRGGHDQEAGTVLLWRDTSTGQPWHSALTIGDGWAFEKASQCWWSPRYVAGVEDVKRVSRGEGLRLERWRLQDSGV